MPRAKRGFKRNHRKNKVFKMAKGFHFDRRTTYRRAVETVKRALHYRYISRRLLKREMRALWITRISAASKELGTSYSKFMGLASKNDLKLNRKMLSELAARDFDAFKNLYASLKK